MNSAEDNLPLVRYSVDIDFDEASRAWRANKKKNKDGDLFPGSGSFSYICGAICSNGKVCTKVNCKNVKHAKQKMIDVTN
jgi:hypothetical protein